MNNRILVTLPLAAMLAFPAFAQTSSTPTQDQSNPSATSTQSGDTATGKQPLQAPAREGFWGRVNPFARKNYVKRQTEPIRARINELAAIPATLVFFESPRRLAETLADLATELGSRPAAVARELTKLYETTRRGPLDRLAAEYAAEAPPKGEIVVLVGPPQEAPPVAEEEIDRRLATALETLSVKDASAAVSAETGAPRRHVYARAIALVGAKR